MSDDTYIVFVSIPRDEARAFAKKLIDKRLGACVNIIPKMESFYWWDDKVLEDSESLLLVKTSAARYEELRDYVETHHPYDLPEVVAVSMADGLPDYLAWIRRETK